MGWLLVAGCSADRTDPTGPAIPGQCLTDECHALIVPAGPFTMGCNDDDDDQCDADERPAHEVHLDAFAIERTEVSVAQYAECVTAGACTAPSSAWSACNWGRAGRDNHPVNCLDFEAGQAFCAWRGWRLPTEAEWEKAARGTDRRIYPWGNEPPSCDRVNGAGCAFDTTPVGSMPAGASPYGVLDLAGNLLEWVSDGYDESYYSVSPAQNPTGPSESVARVARGGSYYGFPRYLRTSIRDRYYVPYEGDYIVGVRCARSL